MATYVITEACIGVKDATCVDVCPVACIHTTPDAPQYYIDPEVCIACEQCFFVCPVNAIFLDSDVPAQLQNYLQINADFFLEHKAAAEPISVAQARAIVEAVETYAATAGLSVVVAVTENDGNVLVSGAAGSPTSEASDQAANKAYTAALLEVATHQLARGAERPSVTMPPGFDESRMLAEGGGCPLMEESQVIGAIGVAGSGSPQIDLQCCQAGLAALRAAVS